MKIKKFNQINEGDKNDISEKEFYKFEKDNMVYYGVERKDGEIDIFDGYGNLKPYTYFFSDGFNYDILKNIEYKSLPKEVIDAIKVREADTFKDIIGSTSMKFYKYLMLGDPNYKLGKYYYIIVLSDETVLGFDISGNIIKNEFMPSKDTILEPVKHKLPSKIIIMLNAIQIGDADKNEYVLHEEGDIEEIKSRIKKLKDMNQKELNNLLNQAIDDGDFSRAFDISQFMKESKTVKTFKQFINENYNKNEEHLGLIWWLEYEYPWDYVESEGMGRHRFDWNNGEYSFWLNDDLSGEGQLPPELKDKVIEKGVKLYD